jgi:hypothetical protein
MPNTETPGAHVPSTHRKTWRILETTANIADASTRRARARVCVCARARADRHYIYFYYRGIQKSARSESSHAVPTPGKGRLEARLSAGKRRRLRDGKWNVVSVQWGEGVEHSGWVCVGRAALWRDFDSSGRAAVWRDFDSSGRAAFGRKSLTFVMGELYDKHAMERAFWIPSSSWPVAGSSGLAFIPQDATCLTNCANRIFVFHFNLNPQRGK